MNILNWIRHLKGMCFLFQQSCWKCTEMIRGPKMSFLMLYQQLDSILHLLLPFHQKGSPLERQSNNYQLSSTQTQALLSGPYSG